MSQTRTVADSRLPAGLSLVYRAREGWLLMHDASGLPVSVNACRTRAEAVARLARVKSLDVDWTLSATDFQAKVYGPAANASYLAAFRLLNPCVVPFVELDERQACE